MREIHARFKRIEKKKKNHLLNCLFLLEICGGGEGRGEERRSRENLDLFNFLVRQGIAKRATTVTRYEKNEAFSFRARFDQLARTMVS